MADARWKENVLVFDLETQNSFDDVGGQRNAKALKLSLAVVYHYRTGEYVTYREGDASRLIDDLFAADRVIGFNVVRFDYEVLRAYTERDFKPLAAKTVDMLLDVEKVLGHRVALNAFGAATLGAKKSADGLLAIQWYREGKFELIEEYCRQDVRLTKDLFEYGCKNEHLLFESKYAPGKPKKVDVKWTLPSAGGGPVQGRLF